MGHVNADLMGAAGFQAAFDQGRKVRLFSRAETLLDLPMGDCMPATCLDDGHLLPVALGSGQIGVDRALQAGRCAPDDRGIGSLKRAAAAMIRELVSQPLMRLIRFRHHQQTGRVLVDPVHDPRVA